MSDVTSLLYAAPAGDRKAAASCQRIRDCRAARPTTS